MKRAYLCIFVAMNLVVIAGFWLWNSTQGEAGNLLSSGSDGLYLALGRLAGLLAAFFALLQLLLIGRVPWIEHAFGLDRLTILHKYNALVVLIVLVAHGGLLTMHYAARHDLSWWGQTAEFIENWEDVPVAMIASAVLVAVVVMSSYFIRKFFKYEVWYFAHLATYAALALAFGHQLEHGGDLADHAACTGYWYALYAFVVGSLVMYRFVQPAWRYGRHHFRIARVVRETDDVTSVYIAGRNLETLKSEAGQFIMARFLCPGCWWQSHPFSLSCAVNGAHLRISVKALGDFTAGVKNLAAGTRVVIDGPHGVFTTRRMRTDKALLIAGGIGITPLRALAEKLSEQGIDTVLLYSSRTGAGIVFKDELDVLATRGSLKVHHVVSNDAQWRGETGRIDGNMIARLVPDFAGRDVFVCGPPAMMDGTLATLRSRGVPSRCIHAERFAL